MRKTPDLVEELKKEFPQLKTNFPLAKISFLRIGGRADFYLEVSQREELIKAVKFARLLCVPHLIIGGASNVLFSDEGFRGWVIKNSYQHLELFGENKVWAGSGVPLLALIKQLAEFNLGGLEFLAGIPGTLGGAVVNNAGAFSREIKEVVEGVRVLDEEGKEQFWSRAELRFGYRTSCFKHLPSKSNFLKYPVILEVLLTLVPKSREEVLRLINSYIGIRTKKQPQEPSLGCVFKNPENQPAGMLLDKAGLKGKRKGRIKISEKHANFFVNLGRGKAQDYLALIQEAKQAVKEKFGILLEEEIEIIPPQ
ncbi:UDP-N-acetylmuramate dehydrogenase [bacterium]|nr:UDP-N-acetylmuramate dehydrogenase [bacterium]